MTTKSNESEDSKKDEEKETTKDESNHGDAQTSGDGATDEEEVKREGLRRTINASRQPTPRRKSSGPHAY
jgi:hypothetical protein